jgi:hypothetical protein
MEKRVIIIKKHKGIGDTVAAITKATGLDKLVGKDCGCPERQEAWNDPELLVNRVFYGTKQDIEVLREQSEGSGEA